MQLIRRLQELQGRRGYLDADDLRALAAAERVPLHRIQELVSFYPHFRTAPPRRFELFLCRDLACHLAGGPAACARARKRWEQAPDVEIHDVSCLGRCDRAPAALVNGVPTTTEAISAAGELTFLLQPSGAPAPEHSWRCDPYQSEKERFGALRGLLDMTRPAAAEKVLAELKASGLCGMGGAGFPTGAKWELVRRQSRTPKYVICNADESEPGAFKDREILRQLPHLVIEGMILAGLTVGASHGILYIRHEYEPERQVFRTALDQARRAGLLGYTHWPFEFNIEIFVSPGGYILGEETALLEALEDKRGEPRNKPPYPGTHGLFGQPTLINNVETLAMVPGIVANGGDWWQGLARLRRVGTFIRPHSGLQPEAAAERPHFHGVKFMAVSGQVENPGVYEVPFGTTVRALIELAGGVKGGRPLKAFAPGGASSHFLPASMVDVPIDFTTLAKAGSMLGAGALVVVALETDMLDLATNVVRFFRNESCGKCVPCRLGTQQAVQLLEAHRAGQGNGLDPDFFKELGETLALTSICGLGQVALNPLLSVTKHWPEEVHKGNKD